MMTAVRVFDEVVIERLDDLPPLLKVVRSSFGPAKKLYLVKQTLFH